LLTRSTVSAADALLSSCEHAVLTTVQALKQERDALAAQLAQLQQQSSVQRSTSTTATAIATGTTGSSGADHSAAQVSGISSYQRLFVYLYAHISLFCDSHTFHAMLFFYSISKDDHSQLA
jgi:hypothetical protein